MNGLYKCDRWPDYVAALRLRLAVLRILRVEPARRNLPRPPTLHEIPESRVGPHLPRKQAHVTLEVWARLCPDDWH